MLIVTALDDIDRLLERIPLQYNQAHPPTAEMPDWVEQMERERVVRAELEELLSHNTWRQDDIGKSFSPLLCICVC